MALLASKCSMFVVFVVVDSKNAGSVGRAAIPYAPYDSNFQSEASFNERSGTPCPNLQQHFHELD